GLGWLFGLGFAPRPFVSHPLVGSQLVPVTFVVSCCVGDAVIEAGKRDLAGIVCSLKHHLEHSLGVRHGGLLETQLLKLLCADEVGLGAHTYPTRMRMSSTTSTRPSRPDGPQPKP